MPREREVTMGKVTPQEAHEAAIQKAIKLHRPYAVVDGELAGSEYPYAVVYTAPLGSERQVVGERNKRANATSLRDHLSRAWAEGYYASTTKGTKL
jgi:hypothetical protein